MQNVICNYILLAASKLDAALVLQVVGHSFGVLTCDPPVGANAQALYCANSTAKVRRTHALQGMQVHG